MTNIDWTQPVETTETPPRPVRVLFDKDGSAAAVHVGEYILSLGSPHLPTLRNVAPPKPEPEFHDSLEWDELVAERDKWKAACEHNIKTLDIVQAERDSLKAEVERLVEDRAHQMDIRNGTIEDLRAEIARMRPVVDAAMAYGNSTDPSTRNPAFVALMKATYAYQQEIRRGAMAKMRPSTEAVANVAKMMGPVKSCNNCRHDRSGICAIEGPFSFDPDEDCVDWEMKQ